VVCEGNVLRFNSKMQWRHGEFQSAIPETLRDTGADGTHFEFPNHGGQHVELLQNFVDAILDGKPLISPAHEGIGAVELANAMVWSAARGEPVTLR